MVPKVVPTYNHKTFFTKKNDYALVIPIINEGEKFKKLLIETKPYTKFVDLIIADGGSTDGSTNRNFLISQKVRTLLVKTGPGKLGAQMRMAFDYVLKEKYKGIITMDGNGKDEPASIPDYIKKLDEGYDYIQGSRFIKGGKAINTPPDRYWSIRLFFSPLLSLFGGYWYTDVTNGHRAYSSKLLSSKSLSLFRDIFQKYEILFYITVRAKNLGFSVIEIPVVRKYPKIGKTPTKMTTIASKLDLIMKAIDVAIGRYNP